MVIPHLSYSSNYFTLNQEFGLKVIKAMLVTFVITDRVDLIEDQFLPVFA